MQALSEAGIDYDPSLTVDPRGHSVQRGYWSMDALMTGRRRPTAIFAANDSLALGALRWCLKSGVAVPDEVAIIGMDNIEFAEFAGVPLSSVNYPVDIITELAVERLMDLIEAGELLPDARVTQIDPELVVRDSTLARAS